MMQLQITRINAISFAMMTRYPRRTRAAVLALLVTGLCAGAPAPVAMAQEDAEAAAESPVALEINRVEDVAAGCRVYFVTANGLDAPLDPFTLDIVAFDRDGVVATRLAVDLAPVPAGKTMVRLFDVAGPACDGLSALLLNDVVACAAGGLEGRACLDAIAVSSRGPVDLRL